jgi:hypothetical protein
MARMSREFSLVLVGAGVLTAGYFYFSEDEKLFAKEEEHARQQVSSRRGGPYYGPLIFYHASYSNGRINAPSTASNVTRGGFGGIGRITAGG